MKASGLIEKIENHDNENIWEQVENDRYNRRLQQKHPLKEAAQYRGWAEPCPKFRTAGTGLVWFYFLGPSWTWEHLCGRAGWMTVCDARHFNRRELNQCYRMIYPNALFS